MVKDMQIETGEAIRVKTCEAALSYMEATKPGGLRSMGSLGVRHD